MDKNQNQAQIPALDRGIDLLEWMASRMEAVTLTQISQGLGLSVSEIQRPVACLNRRGYLNRSEAGTYFLSGRLSALVQGYPPHLRLQQAALGAMTEFARLEAESVHLCVPDGDCALLLLDVPGGGLVRLSLQQGAKLDALSTVSGRILSSYGALRPANIDNKMRAVLKKIQEVGFENAESSQVVGITDIGVPVFDGHGQIVAALTVSSLRMKNAKQGVKKFLPALKNSSQNISKGL